VGGNLTNTIQNSGNSFKPISKNSGNVFKNQYQIDVNSGDEEEERQNEVETEKNNGNPDVLRQLDLLQRVLATAILGFILFLLLENYINRTDINRSEEVNRRAGSHILYRRDVDTSKQQIDATPPKSDWLYRPRVPDSSESRMFSWQHQSR